MAVPNLAGALRGWTSKREVQFITKTINTDGRSVETYLAQFLEINIQPMPPERIKNKPEEQWSWKWWSLIIKGAPNLKTQDAFILDGLRYRVEEISNWGESGFRKYGVVEDFAYPITPGPEPTPPPVVLFGGSPLFFEDQKVIFEEET